MLKIINKETGIVQLINKDMIDGWFTAHHLATYHSSSPTNKIELEVPLHAEPNDYPAILNNIILNHEKKRVRLEEIEFFHDEEYSINAISKRLISTPGYLLTEPFPFGVKIDDIVLVVDYHAEYDRGDVHVTISTGDTYVITVGRNKPEWINKIFGKYINETETITIK